MQAGSLPCSTARAQCYICCMTCTRFLFLMEVSCEGVSGGRESVLTAPKFGTTDQRHNDPRAGPTVSSPCLFMISLKPPPFLCHGTLPKASHLSSSALPPAAARSQYLCPCATPPAPWHTGIFPQEGRALPSLPQLLALDEPLHLYRVEVRDFRPRACTGRFRGLDHLKHVKDGIRDAVATD